MLLKTVGSVLIITGTAVGAGMLALPMVTAELGFIGTLIALFVTWAVMTYTALLIVESHLFFGRRASFSTMAQHTLGPFGKGLTWVTFLLLLYALDAAYMTGGASLLRSATLLVSGYHPSHSASTFIFAVILGTFVTWGVKAVDRLNRCLMLVKAGTFIVLLCLILPHINGQLLLQPIQQYQKAWWALPILITSFGFHIVIPSVADYVGNDATKLRKIVLIGSTLPLIIYLLWEVSILGVLPLHGPHSFASLRHHDIGELTLILHQRLHSKMLTLGVNGFTDVAVSTSFLGVSLGLFDFLADGFKLNKKQSSHKIALILLTFALPLSFALFYPHGFVAALGYASIFVSILLIIMPPLMARFIRQHYPQQYRVIGGAFLLWLAVAFGVLVIIVEGCRLW